MRAPVDLMMLDNEGFMPSLAALDVLISTSTPTPIVDEQTKTLAAANAVTAAESVGIPTQDQTAAAVKAANAAVADAKAKSIAATAQSIAAAKAAAKNVGAGPDARADQAAAAAAADAAAVAAKTLKEVTAAAKEIKINADPDVIAAKANQAAAVGEVTATNKSLAGALANLEALTNSLNDGPSIEVTQALRDATVGLDTNAGLSVLNPVPVTTASTASTASTTASTASTASTTASTSATNTDYTTVNGVLMYKGGRFTGTYNGQEYVDGVVKQVVANPADYSTVNGVLMYKGSAYTGDYQGKKYINGQVISSEGTGLNYSGSGTSLDPFMESGKAFTGTKFGSTYVNGVIVNMAQKTADDIAKQGRLDARTEFGNTLKALGLPQDLIDEIDTMIKQDYTNSQMYLELQKTTAWKNRFPGMAALSAAGKAIDAGTYISQEKSMLQTLDYYGLDKNLFGTTAELGKQIANLVSPKRFETVVALAAQDVEQNPDVLAELNLYYGVDKSAAISYLLNPTIGLDIIQRQARAAEIGAKAAKSKFDFGVSKEGYGVAESFINAAGTMDLQSLDVAFQQARGLADTQANIAATEGAAYNDLSAVSAILGKDQAAILDSQRRAARSVARFSGGSGLGSGSLKTESSI